MVFRVRFKDHNEFHLEIGDQLSHHKVTCPSLGHLSIDFIENKEVAGGRDSGGERVARSGATDIISKEMDSIRVVISKEGSSIFVDISRTVNFNTEVVEVRVFNADTERCVAILVGMREGQKSHSSVGGQGSSRDEEEFQGLIASFSHRDISRDIKMVDNMR